MMVLPLAEHGDYQRMVRITNWKMVGFFDCFSFVPILKNNTSLIGLILMKNKTESKQVYCHKKRMKKWPLIISVSLLAILAGSYFVVPSFFKILLMKPLKY